MSIRSIRFVFGAFAVAALVALPVTTAMGRGGGGGGGGHGGGGGGGHGGGGHMGGGGGWGAHIGGDIGGVNVGGGYRGSFGGGGSWGANVGGHSYAGSSHGDWHGGYGDHGGYGPHPGPHHGPDWHGGWGWSGVWVGWSPWIGFGWSPGYVGYSVGVPYAGDAYVAYGDNSAYATFKPADSDVTTAPDGSVTPADESTGEYVPEPSKSTAEASGGGDDPFDFHARAQSTFEQGDYRQATYMAAHAVVDEPRNPKIHLLYSLGLLAMNEYRGAAMEAHAVVALGPTPDWATLYAFYNNVEPYSTQLRALEKFVQKNLKSPEGRFLLGFHYLVGGHPDEAKVELLEALKLAPRDRIAAKLLKEAGGTIPPDIAKQLAETSATATPKAAIPKPPKPLQPAEK